MQFFHSLGHRTPSWDGFTLLVPSVSVGNVGQLAADLIISTLEMRKVGMIVDDSITPVVGPDPFATVTSDADSNTTLMTSCEVFESTSRKLLVIQHRAPLIRGMQSQYVQRLTQFCKDHRLAQVVILCGSHAHERLDAQIGGDQRRFLASTDFDQSPLAAKLTPPAFLGLERRPGAVSGEDVHPYIPGGGVAKRLFLSCQEQSIPALVLMIFCAEGDNVPEAFSLADKANDLMDIKDSTQTSSGGEKSADPKWKIPPSWSALFGNPAPDVELVFG